MTIDWLKCRELWNKISKLIIICNQYEIMFGLLFLHSAGSDIYLLLRKWIIQGQNANTVIQVVETEQIDLTHSDSTKHLSI